MPEVTLHSSAAASRPDHVARSCNSGADQPAVGAPPPRSLPAGRFGALGADTQLLPQHTAMKHVVTQRLALGVGGILVALAALFAWLINL